MWGFAYSFGEPVIGLNDIMSNDIYAGLITYGVEMARALILKEIRNVFGAYNIDVDIRHLELIADYMVSRSSPSTRCRILHCLPRHSKADISRSTVKAFRQIRHHCSKHRLRRQLCSSEMRLCTATLTI